MLIGSRWIRCVAAVLSAALVGSGLLPPAHGHFGEDPDHAVVHQHLAPHHPVPAQVPRASDDDDDGPILVITQHARVPDGVRVPIPIGAALYPFALAKDLLIGHEIAPRIDGSPPHGPPRRHASLRAPPVPPFNA